MTYQFAAELAGRTFDAWDSLNFRKQLGLLI